MKRTVLNHFLWVASEKDSGKSLPVGFQEILASVFHWQPKNLTKLGTSMI